MGEVSWITVDITDSTIDLTVEANSEVSARTATLIVSYPGANDVSLTVIQEVQYTYNYALSEFSCSYYSGTGDSGEDMFYLWLSDLGFSDDGYTQAGGHYYNFALLASETDGTYLPTGTYTYSASFSGNMVFSGDYSRYIEQHDTGYDEIYLAGGYITVSADGDTYTIEGTVIDENGALHVIYYTGPTVINDYDYDVALSEFAGYFYNGYGTDGSDLFYIFLSDLGFNEYGNAIAGGNYYNLSLFVSDADGTYLPTGTYTYSEITGGNMVIGQDSKYVYMYSTGYNMIYISDGSITVSADGDTYTIEGSLTDYNGAVHRIYYNGPAEIEDLSSDLIDGVEFEASSASGYYWMNSNGVMNVEIAFTDMASVGGITIYNGNYLKVDTYMPYDADGKIATGTYTVSSSRESMTMDPQYCIFVVYESQSSYTQTSISSGTMTVEEGSGDNAYSVTCDLETSDGISVKCTYEGDIVVSNMPSTSSLTTSSGDGHAIPKFRVVSSDESRTNVVSKTLKVKK